MFAEFSRSTWNFNFYRKMDNKFVFSTRKCKNPENVIQIRALLEPLVYHQYPTCKVPEIFKMADFEFSPVFTSSISVAKKDTNLPVCKISWKDFF
jgi:hypothetical protein